MTKDETRLPDQPTAIPAATLILFRDRAGALPELLMVERATAMAFAGGAMVFPGGRLDPGDCLLASDLQLDPVIGPAAIAAIRETIEEVGIAVGLEPAPAADATSQLGDSLRTGAKMGPALKQAGLALNVGALIPFARWRPDIAEKRVFDTHFSIARAPNGAQAEADGSESVLAHWTTAKEILSAARAGERRIVFPTERNLER